MTTPPGGPSYGNGRDQQLPGSPLKRFNFPSAPSDHVREEQPQPSREPVHPPQYERQPPAPPQQQAPRPPSRIQPAPSSSPRPEAGGGEGRGEPQQLVRPYAMTGGRTRPRYQLAIEALVHTTAETAQLQGQLPEHQRICHLCYEIKSVAEISALLSIPLGVARILVADLAEAGLVAIHQPGGGDSTADGQPDVTLLERVLSGLRKL
ncbi:DUF742 domain-containing protein [Streptomyces sp. N2-109]|uniref:DUF742 domain-containing protein n=1 Tax=Streptomyces gossypii TaxID=2883101 RepID=A0ABT2JY33_9ACTN|nr:DUF742 domain-containing protein [Streptomyces gossypii]MCT2592631.1 DUF742 domain-containing protein [Streptomyces gossypii]